MLVVFTFFRCILISFIIVIIINIFVFFKKISLHQGLKEFHEFFLQSILKFYSWLLNPDPSEVVFWMWCEVGADFILLHMVAILAASFMEWPLLSPLSSYAISVLYQNLFMGGSVSVICYSICHFICLCSNITLL